MSQLSISRTTTGDLSSYFAASVVTRLTQALAAPGCLWTTDADGTLWRDDIGEAFLQQLIADQALVAEEARGVDVWRSYEDRVALNKATGYAWAAQVMAGMPEREVQERAAAVAAEFVPSHVLPEMIALVDEARARGCETWIVSASPRWIVEAAARVLDLSPDRVLAMEVRVRDGRLTSEIALPIMYKSGKVDAIHQRIGRAPTLASGDSDGDTEMLQTSTVPLLVVHPGKTNPILLQRAAAGGWLTHVVSDRR